MKIPERPTIKSSLEIEWLQQERATHKPKWLRFFSKSGKIGSISYSDIVLYDFCLTEKGALKKKSRDYLKDLYT